MVSPGQLKVSIIQIVCMLFVFDFGTYLLMSWSLIDITLATAALQQGVHVITNGRTSDLNKNMKTHPLSGNSLCHLSLANPNLLIR